MTRARKRSLIRMRIRTTSTGTNTGKPTAAATRRTAGAGAKRHGALLMALALGALPALSQSNNPGIRIGDTDVSPESVTSTSDGTVYAGSMKGNVYRAAPGESVALPWIRASEENRI